MFILGIVIEGTKESANWRSYVSAPWRKSRICARLILHPQLTDRPRYRKLAAILTSDPDVSNRLIMQAIWHLKGRAYQRSLAN